MARNEIRSKPGQLDLRFKQGSPFAFTFRMPDDQSAFTFAAQVRRFDVADDVAAEFTVSVDPNDGTLVTATLSAVDTAPLGHRKYVWALERLEDDFEIFEGEVRVDPDVRRAAP